MFSRSPRVRTGPVRNGEPGRTHSVLSARSWFRRGVNVLNTMATVIALVLGVHVIAKFTVFALPYARLRAALRASPRGTRQAVWRKTFRNNGFRPSCPALIVALAVLFVWRGLEGVSFIAELWIGATLNQLYFHTYHYPVEPDRAAPPQTSPLKQMSYAVQDAPWRTWPQMPVLAALIICGIIAII